MLVFLPHSKNWYGENEVNVAIPKNVEATLKLRTGVAHLASLAPLLSSGATRLTAPGKALAGQVPSLECAGDKRWLCLYCCLCRSTECTSCGDMAASTKISKDASQSHWALDLTPKLWTKTLVLGEGPSREPGWVFSAKLWGHGCPESWRPVFAWQNCRGRTLGPVDLEGRLLGQRELFLSLKI